MGHRHHRNRDEPRAFYERGHQGGSYDEEWGYGGRHGSMHYGDPPEAGRPDHRGRGPKGYRRSDDRIREDVCEELMAHPFIDASEMEVEVTDGEVTLRGDVDMKRTKNAIEDLVDSVPGVVDVHNHLRVRYWEWDPEQIHRAIPE